jgi:hypothetical protein
MGRVVNDFASNLAIYVISLSLMVCYWVPVAFSDEPVPKRPPEDEALIPYLIKVDKLDRLHPPFPLYPVRDHTELHPESLFQADYRAYRKAMESLSSHLKQLETMFTEAEKQAGETTISVQQLSARLTSFLMHYNATFKDMPPNLQQLSSYKAMNQFTYHAKDVLYTLKARGSHSIHYRPMFEDVNEEDLILNRLLAQIRVQLAQIHEYQEMHQAVTYGFYKDDK